MRVKCTPADMFSKAIATGLCSNCLLLKIQILMNVLEVLVLANQGDKNQGYEQPHHRGRISSQEP